MKYIFKFPAPFRDKLAAQFRAHLDDRVGSILPLIGPAGINHCLGSEHSAWIGARVFLIRWNCRIGRTAPTAPDDLDRSLGVGPGGNGPNHIAQIGDIDVVIDHNRVSADVNARGALRSEHPSLAGMAWVALLDGDHVKKPAPARFM